NTEVYAGALVSERPRSGRSWSAAWRPRIDSRSSAKYVSGNVAVVQTELRIGYIEKSAVDRVIVCNIYEIAGGKIAVATLVGQRTDPQTARFIEWFRSQPQ